MNPKPCRLYVHHGWPRWLAVFMIVLSVSALTLYFAAPDVPKLSVIPIIALFAVAVLVSHRASLSWIEISADGMKIRFVPSWYTRKAWQEPEKKGEIAPGCELLLCWNTSYGFFDGYSFLLRPPGKEEQCLWKSDRGLDFRRASKFAGEIVCRYDLPVRLVARNVTSQGTIEEKWSAATGKVEKKVLIAAVLLALLPLTGVVVRLLTPEPAVIAISGATIAGVSGGLVWLLSRERAGLGKKSAAGWGYVLWVFQFSLYYLVVVLVTDAVTKRWALR